jgi:hypothetical protein
MTTLALLVGLVCLGFVLWVVFSKVDAIKVGPHWSRFVMVALVVLIFFEVRSAALPASLLFIPASPSDVVRLGITWGLPLVLIAVLAALTKKLLKSWKDDLAGIGSQSRWILGAFVATAVGSFALLSASGHF